MLDTANIMTVAATELKYISLLLDEKFKGLGKCQVANDESEASFKFENYWINNIRLKAKGFEQKETIIQVDFSYPRFFSKDNVQLISTEKEREEVNRELLRLIREFSNDKTLKMYHLFYLRVDVAQQFEDIFEDYHQIFSLVYHAFVESMGIENKKSKKYLQITGNQDYTTGFSYSYSDFKIKVYNKTAEKNKKKYIPGRKSIIRIEQTFTPRVFKKKVSINNPVMRLNELTMSKLKKEYASFLEEKLWNKLNLVLENQSRELEKKLIVILKKPNPPLKSEIKDMQNYILDFEIIKSIIKNSDINCKRRMKYYYIDWAKNSLIDTENNGSTKTKFFNNFPRLEKLLSNMTGIKTKIEIIQGIPKIDSLKY